jgi:hypothetical protein
MNSQRVPDRVREGESVVFGRNKTRNWWNFWTVRQTDILTATDSQILKVVSFGEILRFRCFRDHLDAITQERSQLTSVVVLQFQREVDVIATFGTTNVEGFSDKGLLNTK